MKSAQERNIPVCFSSDNLNVIKEYARTKGMISYEQAVDELINNLDEE
ncbi:MAG TPA: hypothetical protein VH500_16475 [Nitrososphaeraceae archaeon]|jgi:hypothetical protein